MKILAIDIETRPSLAYVWKLWDENVGLDQLVQSGEMISFAAKWVPGSKTEFWSTFHNSKEEMVNRAWELLDTADVVLHFNGKKFDIPHIQREFLEAGLTPPSPYKHIDLLTTCRSQFKFPSNKLQYVVRQLGLGKKIEHDGFRLWLRCMNNDPEAWKMMKKYNIADCELLEDLYNVVKPWIRNHPSFAAHHSDDICPRCGSDDLKSRGYYILTTGKYPKYKCGGCGGWSRGTKRVDNTEVVSV